ncbi:MAG TPA: HipA domain-containing protein [Solirubrobacteraceae bacterium]|nr:HipA domain-containing protein [Solirubrobacteraceae bacterium]
MTSEELTAAYVWLWLPGASDPVVAGRIEATGELVDFNYGQSYLRRPDAISIYDPELPLIRGRIPPLPGLSIAGAIADAGPDAWGKRVIMSRLLGPGSSELDPAELSPLAYLLGSGSDRIGALDFQASASEYIPRYVGHATLEEMLQAAELVERGAPLTPSLEQALMHGSSVGGARPKTLLSDGGRSLIAKLSSTSDPYPVVKGEFAAMELARRAGLNVAAVRIEEVMGRDVLLVERFDRPRGSSSRRALVSALTILGLDPMLSRYASYADLAHVVRERFTEPRDTLRELFARITFNILVGNTDDHARNHAAFWDGHMLTLTPAYDICPQRRSGGEATQAMIVSPDGYRMSQLAGTLRAAAVYGLRESEARDIADRQIEVIRAEWGDVCELAGMSEIDRAYFWRRQFLNPYALEGFA